MAAGLADERADDLAFASPAGGELSLSLHAEQIAVSRRRVDTALVRAQCHTSVKDAVVDEQLRHERVDVRHVPIDRVVQTVPAIRQEGDTTIVSVVEEVLVVERRLILKEEVHFRRVSIQEQYTQTVPLRSQHVVVTRVTLDADAHRPDVDDAINSPEQG